MGHAASAIISIIKGENQIEDLPFKCFSLDELVVKGSINKQEFLIFISYCNQHRILAILEFVLLG